MSTVEPTEVLPARADNAAAQTGTAPQPAPVAVSLPRVERQLHLHDNRTTVVHHHHYEADDTPPYRHQPATVASAATRRATGGAFALAAVGSAVLAVALLVTGPVGFASVPLLALVLNGVLAVRVVRVARRPCAPGRTTTVAVTSSDNRAAQRATHAWHLGTQALTHSCKEVRT